MQKMMHDGGFECEFVERPPSVVQSECPVCLLVLRNPYQVTCCGYSFCRACIERIKLRDTPCPCCKEGQFDHYPNKGLQRSLNGFKVQCSNKEQGCQWEGELGQLDNHLNYNPPVERRLKGCQFSELKCLYCLQLFLRSKIQVHQSDQCLRRPFSCEYCKDYDSYYEDVTTNHWPVCDHYPKPCPNQCGALLKSQNLDSHITNDCPLTVVNCDFQHLGCELRLPRKQMPVHIEKRVVYHQSLQATFNKRISASMAKLEEDNKRLKQQVVKLSRDLELQQICAPLCPVEFTITDFTGLKENNVYWFGPPFYTAPKAYKMCFSVYINGFGRGQNTYVSVYTQLMRGEFDDRLKWPFQGSVDIQLLSQEQGTHFTKTFDYSSYLAKDGGERITKGDRSTKKCGFSMFISHSNLQPNYLKNDCLKFCINVRNPVH